MNVLIIEDEKALDSLIQSGALKPIGSKEYIININGISFSVCKELDHLKHILQNKEDDNKTNSKSSKSKTLFNNHISRDKLKSEYERFLNIFPSSDMFDNFRRTRTLKSDARNQGFSRFSELVQDHNILPERIIEALQYELYWRKKESIATNENKLTYMRASTAWLNDIINIKNQLEQKDNDKDYINNPDSSIKDLYDDL